MGWKYKCKAKDNELFTVAYAVFNKEAKVYERAGN